MKRREASVRDGEVDSSRGVIGSQLGRHSAGFAIAVLFTSALLLLSPLPLWADSPAVGVLVTVVPQAFFVDRIAGARVSTSILVPAGRSPHTFEPTPTQMIEAATADVYFTIGLPFELGILSRISDMNPDMTVVSTQAIEEEHDHGHDPHTWMNPRLALAQAAAICDALVRIDPLGAEAYRANMDSLRTELLILDDELVGVLALCRGKSFFVFHPAFGHFADAYGLEQIAIEFEGKEPSARELAGLIESASSGGVGAVFVQPQHPARSAQTLADEIGAAIVIIDPLAYDYPESLRKIAAAVKEYAR